MKRIPIIIALLFAGNYFQAQIQQICIQEAAQAGVNAMRDYGFFRELKDVVVNVKYDSSNNAVLYEVVSDNTCVLLSGSKACKPVLGLYSHPSNNMSIINDYNKLPCTLRSIIDDYILQIASCFRNDTIQLFFAAEWDSLTSNSNRRFYEITNVGPLIKTMWGQDSDFTKTDPYAYNFRIRSGDTCLHCKTGCGATAIAQVMNYWCYPLIMPEYSVQFDWCVMPQVLNTESLYYEKEREAVSYLMEKCAKALNSSYGCNQTFSSEENTKKALLEVFNYSTDFRIRKRDDYSYSEWCTMLKNHIDWGFPVLYRGGGGGGGHIFICDGYNSDELFHFNWGWGGDFDGYYSLNNLNPGNHSYPLFQRAYFYIHPSSNTDVCDIELDLGVFYEVYENIHTQGTLNHPYFITPQTMTKLFSASSSTDSAWRTIPSGIPATYQAHEEVVLRDGFTAKRGCDFTARIVPCERCGERDMNEYDTPMADNADYGNHDNSDGPIAYAAGRMEDSDGLYPNPTDGRVTVATDCMVESLFIYTAAGRPVGGWKYLGIGENRVTLDVSRLPQGAYLLRIHTPQGTATKKLTVRR